MKFRRILSVFLLTVLLSVSFLPTAYAELDLTAEAVLLVDTKDDTILYEKRATDRMYPASITKVMTAILVLEAVERGELSMDQMVTVSRGVIENLDPEASNVGLEPGEQMSVKDLLYCTLLVSACEACDVLAEAVAGSVDAFVVRMNNRAEQLGMKDTRYANTSGLHHPDHYTTAWDLYILAKHALANDAFMTIANTIAYDVPATNLSDSRELHTTNSLISNWRILGYLYDGAEGLKTGTTDEAGACLLSSAVRGERRIVCVVLGCDGEGNTSQTFPDSIKLYDYGFDNFSTKTILTSDEMIDEMSVKLSKQTSYVVVHPAENLEAVLPNDLSPEELTRTVTFNAEYALAPIAKGDVLGEISLSYGGHVYGSAPLLAQYDVEASKFLTAKYHLEQFLSRTVVQLSILGILILIALFVLWWKLLRPKRRYGRSAKGRRTRSYHGRRRR